LLHLVGDLFELMILFADSYSSLQNFTKPYKPYITLQNLLGYLKKMQAYLSIKTHLYWFQYSAAN